MVNLKKYKAFLKHFVLILTFFVLLSCAHQQYYVFKIEGAKIGINDKSKEATEIENFIKPYREHIDKDLNAVLAYTPQTLDKSGEWQSTIGNLIADVTFQKANLVFNSLEKKNIDICLLNHGGIRSIIPKGDVTARTAFEIMPFENTSIVIALKSEQISEMINYIISEKKPHPLTGMTFTIDKNNKPKNILIQGKPLVEDRIYYVVTSDYLSNGGDKMVFFKKGITSCDLDYKLRNILIDYFKEVDTIPMINDVRITKE